MTRAWASGSVAWVSALVLAGCQKPATVKVTGATIDGAGKTATLRATVLDGSGSEMKDQTLVWSSDNPTVAGVNAAGMVTGLKTGSAKISATDGDVHGDATVDVHVPAKITGQMVSFTSIGQKTNVTLAVTDDHGAAMPDATKTITAAITDPKVASVTGSGGTWTVTAVGSGTTQLVAKADPLSQPFAVSVTPADITEVKLGATTLSLKAKTTQKIMATPMAGSAPAGGAVTFSSSNTKVATVDADGTVHGNAKGKATITAMAGGKSATVAVTVTR